MTDVSLLSFYIVVSPPETADLLDSFRFAWMFEESDVQLAHEVPQSRREKIKEMNTAVCVNAVAKSSTILLPIVINKLGHSDPPKVLSHSSSVDCISLQLDNQQDNSSFHVDHSALSEQTVVSFKLHHTSSKNIL